MDHINQENGGCIHKFIHVRYDNKVTFFKSTEKSFQFISTGIPYPAYSKVGRKNLVSRHSVLHFPTVFETLGVV